MTSAVDNRRLAKNTMVLYFRMLFQMAVFFYTSRVIIGVLGVVDYGVYDVVAGLAVAMMFLNNALATGSQRFITVALGKGDKEYLNKIFSACIVVHCCLAVIVLILAETIGIWYMHTYMNIPSGRFDSALILFQCSVISMMLFVINVPFYSVLIAYERMPAFAALSIFDVLCKLGIVIALPYFQYDKLITYGVLLMIEAFIHRGLYVVYYCIEFKELKFVRNIGFGNIKQILSFVGWNSLSNTALVCNTQGINLLLNYIGGPVVNAARGVAVSVQSAISCFVASFLTAVYPQITKAYAQEDLRNMVELVSRSSRLSFCLISILSVPLLVETPTLLGIWLDNVPPYSVSFTRLLIIISMVDAFATPLMVGAAATGRAKFYYSIEGGMLLSALPLACLIAYWGYGANAVFVMYLCVTIATQCVRVVLCHELFGLPRKKYFIQEMIRGIIAFLIALTLPYILQYYLPNNLWLHLCNSILSAVWSAMCIIIIGLKNQERKFALNKAKSIINSKRLHFHF